MSRLSGKVAIITGAGSGIGRACALRFASEGARVVIADLNGANAAAVAEQICSDGGEALAMTVDVADESQLQQMVAGTISHFGELNILFNNACNTDPVMSKKDADFFTFDAEVFHHRMQTNVLAGVLAARFAMPHMLARGSGSILFTSSSSSRKGEVAQFSYGATKAAVNWYVQTIAATFGKRGIRCNGIVPGVIRTAGMERWANDEQGLGPLLSIGTTRLTAAYAPFWYFDLNVRFVAAIRPQVLVDGADTRERERQPLDLAVQRFELVVGRCPSDVESSVALRRRLQRRDADQVVDF